MTGTDLCVNKPHCACASKCLSIMVTKKKSVPVIFEPPCIMIFFGYVITLAITILLSSYPRLRLWLLIAVTMNFDVL